MTKIEVYTDGGARGNPGPAAIGFIIKKEGLIIYRHAEVIGHATNNTAEYTAVLKALTWLENNPQLPITNPPAGRTDSQFTITFYLDSLLVVQQLSGRFKIKNQNLKQLAWQIKRIESELKIKVVYQNIPRVLNKIADNLVNTALNASNY